MAAADDDRVKHGASPDSRLALARLQVVDGRCSILVAMATSVAEMTEKTFDKTDLNVWRGTKMAR